MCQIVNSDVWIQFLDLGFVMFPDLLFLCFIVSHIMWK